MCKPNSCKAWDYNMFKMIEFFPFINKADIDTVCRSCRRIKTSLLLKSIEIICHLSTSLSTSSREALQIMIVDKFAENDEFSGIIKNTWSNFTFVCQVI